MAIKKSELYSSLWASCDELRGGMDASQYKDYVLVMLFIKYISDQFGGQRYGAITIPKGASFKDMVALKGKTDIGDQINKKIIAPIAEKNKLTDMPDFNDVNKLGSGEEMVQRLTNLIAIFENPSLDFSKNQAEGDDILGDAYEYLMRHFATESGKSKGQFYTPAEVSRIMAKIIGIDKKPTTSETTVYDPTCGSGSLLLKISGVANSKVTLYGQEKDATTSGLARMNMILHHVPTAEIKQGNTLAKPLFKNNEDDNLKTFDYVVANPPFSDKSWNNGLNLPEDHPYNRFQDFGIPPVKNGDYAFLLHIVRSLKPHGKGAIILPHGVLFRGNAEAEIRKNLIRRGYIKGIIGLPANLFYGTGIPACIILIDKEDARNRKGIFMIDAGKGFIKDGNKNRLQEKDIHKIADVFNRREEIAGFSKMVSVTNIEANEFNLNIPRYIESQETEDIQDIEAHLLGDIPNAGIEALNIFWEEYPSIKERLFSPSKRANYSILKVAKDEIRRNIFEHSEFENFIKKMNSLFTKWKTATTKTLKALTQEQKFNPKKLIHQLSEDLLGKYSNQPLIDKYDIYQHLMSYWVEIMQDDCYFISQDGWTCDLVPKDLVINRYFKTEKEALETLQAEKENMASELMELEEEHSSEDGYFTDMEKVNKTNVKTRIKELKEETDTADELNVLKQYIALLDKQTATDKNIKEAEKDLDTKLYAKYPTLTEDEVKRLVVDDKWMHAIEGNIKDEIDHISQRLTNRVKELAERYENPLPVINKEVESLETKVNAHLQKMGFVWK